MHNRRPSSFPRAKAGMDSFSVLSVQDLTVSRAGVVILNSINLDLHRGEAVLLRGANGVGKTTLLRSMAGHITPDAGTIKYADPTTGAAIPGFELVAFCGAVNAIKPSLTVDETLLFWARLYGKDVSSVENAKRQLQLGGYADYPAAALSTGYARRLGLARLLVADRLIWFVDEPTAALDDAAVEDFAKMVETHQRGGGAAIIATHDEIPLENARSLRLSSGRPSP